MAVGIGELTKLVAAESGVTQVAARSMINAVLGTIKDACENGEAVSIQGFGTFKYVTRKARKCINPQTGDMMVVPERDKFVFKAAR